jgi:dihydrofolate synthase / folylpolyglutamate synthase
MARSIASRRGLRYRALHNGYAADVGQERMSDIAEAGTVPSARIEGLIARLHDLHPRLIDLSLDRLRALLDKLGGPEQRLPPVIHVAGTNGKGSTCAFLRAMAEAAGLRVHVYTSPHLVRFNERFRLAGTLVSDAALAAALEEVEQINAGAPITVFEVITAVAFLLFARTPADLCVLEVGLGGRGDATNVIARPAATAITSISLDHREFLGETIEAIAAEKAGILKPGVPVAIGAQPAAAREVLLARAAALGAPAWLRGREWEIAPGRYRDAAGTLDLPAPALPGAHQWDNAGIALAALRAAGLGLPDRTLAAGVAGAVWPARLQRLAGRLAALLPPGWELWLDGGHNPGAGVVLAAQLAAWSDRGAHLVVGMKQAKDTAEFLRPLLAHAAGLWAVAEPAQHLALPVADIVAASGGRARPGPLVADALRRIAAEAPPGGTPARVLICGSLYLAGEVLKQDGSLPS